ncbi:MAG: RHS repeat-associated core domain-containing protein [Patescibacteria group bacterium]|jgi:RHS repeat-associated protein
MRAHKIIILVLLVFFIITPLANVLAYGTNNRFTGQLFDPTANLYDYGARSYQADIGRFIQPDPVSRYLTDPQKLKQSTGQNLQQFLTNPQALNEYSYTQNNPVKYVDPDGEFIIPAALAIAGIVFSGIFLDSIKVVQAPTANSTPQVIADKSSGDLMPGVKNLDKSTRWFAMMGLNLAFSKVSAGKQVVNEIVNKFGTGSTKNLLKMYHGSANQFAEIIENGFQKTGKIWLTDSAAAANAYQYKYGLTDNFGLKILELSKKLFADLIDKGHVVIKDVADERFPFAREYGFDDYARKIINKIIKKE